VWLASLSPAHVGGLALVTRALLLGSRLVAVGAFDAAHVSALIDGAGRPPGVAGTHVSVVPTQLLRLLDMRGGAPPPPSLRCVLVGGAAAPTSLVARALEAGWPLALTYGLTEATSQVATAPPELVRRKPGTVGRPLTGVELRIAADGEILARGATLASGYVATDDVLLDGDGWLHTGDLGRRDAEGDLWVVGRRIDRIVSGGVTVDAAEVEEAIRAHPAVRDAGVVGIPDEEWGERVAAWVEPLGDHAGADALDVSSLDAFLRARLSAAKLPRVWHIAPGLPRNANGKLDRGRVREALARAPRDP
jgi:o-succinylbenzoate---CoA ligase